MIKTAIMVDGAFYRKRAYYFWGDRSPKERAKELAYYCNRHIKDEKAGSELYRVFYYDCIPSGKNIYHPLMKKQIDLSKTDQYKWSLDFFDELKHQRKFALRFGRLAEEQAYYTLKPSVVKMLLNDKIKVEDLSKNDFELNMKQKGVDFILDPMRTVIKPDLFEHIDGMRTKTPQSPKKDKKAG